MGSILSGGGSSGGSSSSGGAASTQAPPNALQQLMGMLGSQSGGGSGGSGSAPAAAAINPFYRPSAGGYTGPAAPTQAPESQNLTQRKPFDATTFNDDGTTATSGVGAGPQVSATPLNKPPTTPSTMSDISNAIFGTNKASAMKSLGSLGAVAGK